MIIQECIMNIYKWLLQSHSHAWKQSHVRRKVIIRAMGCFHSTNTSFPINLYNEFQSIWAMSCGPIIFSITKNFTKTKKKDKEKIGSDRCHQFLKVRATKAPLSRISVIRTSAFYTRDKQSKTRTKIEKLTLNPLHEFLWCDHRYVKPQRTLETDETFR